MCDCAHMLRFSDNGLEIQILKFKMTICGQKFQLQKSVSCAKGIFYK